MTELLQVLSMGRSSGTLFVEGDMTSGWIRLREGRPVEASLDSGLSGEPAFFCLLDNASGSFSFERQLGEDGKGVTIKRSLETLLFEAAQSRQIIR